MDIDTLGDIARATNAYTNYREQKALEQAVQNSKLTSEEKAAAFKSLSRIKLSLFIVIFIIIGMLTAAIIVDTITEFKGSIIWSLIALPASIVLLLVYIFFLQKRLFPTWGKYAQMVAYHLDGLTPAEIEQLKPTAAEQRLIRSYTIKSIIAVCIAIALTAITFIITSSLNVPIKSWTNFFLLVVIFLPTMIYIDSNDAETSRIRDGFYKQKRFETITFACPKCHEAITLQASQLNLDSPTTACPNCHETIAVPTGSYKTDRLDYEKHLQKLQKFESK